MSSQRTRTDGVQHHQHFSENGNTSNFLGERQQSVCVSAWNRELDDLRRTHIDRHDVHIIRQVLPSSADIHNPHLSLKFSFRSDLSRDPRHFRP